MAHGKNPTVDEHFVPRVFLRNFSPDGKSLYRLDMCDLSSPAKLVPMKSVLYRKNLHEIRGNNGEFLDRNYIENTLAKIESHFPPYLEKLIDKAKRPDLYGKPSIFTQEEKNFWTMYVTFQILRTPRVIETSSKALNFYMQNIPGFLTPAEAHGIALSQLFPFFKELAPGNYNFYNASFQKLYACDLFLGVSEQPTLFTADIPIFAYAEDFEKTGVNEIIFPLTPHLALFMFGDFGIPDEIRNTCLLMRENEISHIKENIIMGAERELFAIEPFTQQDLALIEKVMKSEQRREFRKEIEFSPE